MSSTRIRSAASLFFGFLALCGCATASFPPDADAANAKISALQELLNSQLAADDELPVVDTSVDTTKKVKISELDTRWVSVQTDIAPKLGGALDTNGQSLVTSSNADLSLAPNGSGKVAISSELQVAKRVKTADTVVISGTVIDWQLGNGFTKTLTANTTFTFTNVPTNGVQTISVEFVQNATGTWTVTLPALKWPGGTAFTMTTGNGKTDVCTFIAYSSSNIKANCLQDLR